MWVASLVHPTPTPEGSSGKLSFKQHFGEGILDGLLEGEMSLWNPVTWWVKTQLETNPSKPSKTTSCPPKMGLLGFLGKYFYHQKDPKKRGCPFFRSKTVSYRKNKTRKTGCYFGLSLYVARFFFGEATLNFHPTFQLQKEEHDQKKLKHPKIWNVWLFFFACHLDKSKKHHTLCWYFFFAGSTPPPSNTFTFSDFPTCCSCSCCELTQWNMMNPPTHN